LNTDAGQLNAATKLQAWKEVARGKSRGRVYDTRDLTGTTKECLPSLSPRPLLFSVTLRLRPKEKNDLLGKSLKKSKKQE